MNSLTVPIVMLLILAALITLCIKYGSFGLVYRRSIRFWGQWIPVVSAVVYVVILGANIVGPAGPLSLGSQLKFPELIGLFMVGPLFLTSMGNITALATIVYLAVRLSGLDITPPAMQLLIASATTNLVLADRMPWLDRTSVAHKMREILLIALSLSSMGLMFLAFMKIRPLTAWIQQSMGVMITAETAMAVVVVLFTGWLSVAIGLTRHFTLPILVVPSLLVLSYFAQWPQFLLVVPFTMCISLALTTSDRRRLA